MSLCVLCFASVCPTISQIGIAFLFQRSLFLSFLPHFTSPYSVSFSPPSVPLRWSLFNSTKLFNRLISAQETKSQGILGQIEMNK